MTAQNDLLQTPLHSIHLAHNARMMAFAGYAMPVNYPAGIIKEHLHCRSKAGLFDVSHMGQIMVSGDAIATTLETLLPVDLVALAAGRQKYAVLLNDDGAVLDDLMVINLGKQFMLVVNAACKHQDLAEFKRRLGNQLEFTLLEDRALLALQGPAAARVMASLPMATTQDNRNLQSFLPTMYFMEVAKMTLLAADCIVSRSGYSGEDGFEISLPANQAITLGEALLADMEVELIGLGARDSLRMEAGLCLYGQDLSATVTPVEAGLGWAISANRRSGGSRPGGFPGAQKILEQLAQGATVKQVGLMPGGRAPMRAGTALFDQSQTPIGTITSGGFSPSLQRPISMGRVNPAMATNNTSLLAEIRGKMLPVEVSKLPFVQHCYYRPIPG